MERVSGGDVPSEQQLARWLEDYRRDTLSYAPLVRGYLAAGKPDAAMALMAEVIHGVQSPDVDMYSWAGQAQMATGAWQRARDSVEQAIQLAPRQAELHARLGEIYLHLNNESQAFASLQQAQRLNPRPDVAKRVEELFAIAGQGARPSIPLPTPRPALPPPVDSRPPQLRHDTAVDAGHGRAPAGISSEAPAGHTASAPSAAAVPGATIRPRVQPAERRPDAARQELERAAAQGNHHLTDLLAAGLLAFPHVDHRSEAVAVRRVRRRGPRNRRWVWLALATAVFTVVGAVSWRLYTREKRSSQLTELTGSVEAAIASGTYESLRTARAKVVDALAADSGNRKLARTRARLDGLLWAIYGVEPQAAPVDDDSRESLVAAVIAGLQNDGHGDLAPLRARVDSYLQTTNDPPVGGAEMLWLQARLEDAAGNFETADAIRTRALSQAPTHVLTAIDQADSYLDRGAMADALGIYDEVLAGVEHQPLAVLGRGFVLAERGDLQASAQAHIHLDRDLGPTLNAYKELLYARTELMMEEYDRVREHLESATAGDLKALPARLVALAALISLDIDDQPRGKRLLALVPDLWQGDPQHPTVRLLAAERAQRAGQFSQAVALVDGRSDLYAAKLRGWAYWELGQLDRAQDAFEAALTRAQNDREALLGTWALRALRGQGAKRREALRKLNDLGLNSTSKLAPHVQARVLATLGEHKKAKRLLEGALRDVGAPAPHPRAYESHYWLARLALQKQQLARARKHLRASEAHNPSYLPRHKLEARVLLLDGKPRQAVKAFAKLRERMSGDPEVVLWLAEALVTVPDAKPAMLAKARQLLFDAKQRGARVEELRRIAMLLDPAGEILVELGIADEPSR